MKYDKVRDYSMKQIISIMALYVKVHYLLFPKIAFNLGSLILFTAFFSILMRLP